MSKIGAEDRRRRGAQMAIDRGRVSMGKATRLCATLGLAAFFLAGCTSRGGDIAYNPGTFNAPDAPDLPTLATDYHLGVGDTVNVQVFKVESLSGDQTVDSAGRITLALLGPVQAAGLTTDQLAAQLTTDLGKRYLNSPSITVSLKSAVTKTITVDGSVTSPGIYPAMSKTSLLQAIAMAHGTADGANPRRVVIFRKLNGQRTAAAFDLTTIRKGQDPDPAIYPDDVVVVDGSALSKAFKSFLQALPIATVFRPI